MRFLVFFWLVVLAGSYLLWRVTRYAPRKPLRVFHRIAMLQLFLVMAAPVARSLTVAALIAGLGSRNAS